MKDRRHFMGAGDSAHSKIERGINYLISLAKK